MNVLRYFQKQHHIGVPHATEKDLYYCYRLLLGRLPDPAGYASWKEFLKVQNPTVTSLVHGFVQSEEYRNYRMRCEEPTLVSLDDFKIYVRETDASIGAVIAKHRCYEPEVERIIRSVLRPGDTMLDLGANIGFLSLLAAYVVGSGGKVLSFEPNSDNCSLLLRSIIENGFNNIEVYPLAVSDARRSMILEVAGGFSNGKTRTISETASGNVVAAVSLDSFLHDLTSITLIKMDIEGSEPLALRGMQGLVSRFRPKIIFEFSPECIRQTSGLSEESLLDQFSSLGYTFRLINNVQIPVRAQEILEATSRTDDHHINILAVPDT